MIETAQMHWLTCDCCLRNPPAHTLPRPSRDETVVRARAEGWMVDRYGWWRCPECVRAERPARAEGVT